MDRFKFLTGPMRLPFVVLTPACVALGVGTALWETGSLNGWHALLALIGAIGAHVSVNAFNEYFDFKSELDSRTQRTPFSGGSGTLQARPDLAGWALGVAWVAFAITSLVGIYFVFARGAGILPLGVLGLLVILTYTPLAARNPLICLVAPGLGFGTFMVMGTHFALSGTYSWTGFFASLLPFFLVADLLLLNQFPDVEADRRSGRHHFPIVMGRRKSAYLYTAFLALAYLSILLGVLLAFLPPLALLGLATLVLAVPASRRALSYADQVDKLIPALGQNVLVNLITPLLVAIGLILS